MPRRRSTNPTTAISITLTRDLLDQIDDVLTRTQSRSKWIANACHVYLHHQHDVNIGTVRLMAMVHARLPAGVLRDLLYEQITSSNRDEDPATL